MRWWVVLLSFSCCAPGWAALVVTPGAVSATQVPYYYTGDGQGFSMGSCEVSTSNGQGHVLFSITLTSFGNADDSTAFSEVGLFIDSSGNGFYDPGVDTRYGQTYQSYPTDNGSLTFSENAAILGSSPARFFIVVKLNGAVLLYEADDSFVEITAVNGTGGVASGVPTGTLGRIVPIEGPTPLTLEYSVSASGPPYTYDFRLVNDNHNGTWVAGQEWQGVTFGLSNFGVGGAPFTGWVTDSASYPIGPYINTNWAGGSIAGTVYSGPNLTSSGSATWAPGFVGDQLVWWGTVNTFLNEGEMTWVCSRTMAPTGSASLEPARRVGDYLRLVAVPGAALDVGPTETGSGNGFAIGSFDIISHTNAATLSGITVDASGTGDDALAFSDVRLFVDANSSGAFEPGLDSQFGGSFSAYPADDGSLTFNGSLGFNPDETKRLLVVAMLNGATLASYGQTFNTTVTAISATGNMHSGLPSAVIPGIHISAPTLTLTTSAAVQFVSADAQGPGGLGLSVCEFLFANNNEGTANLDSISLAAAGSLFDQTDFSYVSLFLDSNGNGFFDAGDASVAPAVAAFPGDDGTLTFTQAISFAPNQSRRFFLVVRLAGSAAIGADFWCRVAAIGVSGGTETAGIPGTLTECLNVTTGGSNNSGGSSDSDGGCSTDQTTLGWLAWLSALTLLAWRFVPRAFR